MFDVGILASLCSVGQLSHFVGSSEEYLDVLISTKMEKIVRGWKCVECDKEYKQKGDLSRHVEATHIDHPGSQCSLCYKIFKTRDAITLRANFIEENLNTT